MQRVRMQRSHPLTGWAFVVLGCAGLVVAVATFAVRCGSAGIPLWPVEGPTREVLSTIVREALPASVLLVLGVLLPLQQLGRRPGRRSFVARIVTATLLVVAGGLWVARLNQAGFASLWARREPVGDLLVPAALLESRVWWANVMVVLVVAMLSLPLNAFVRRMLARDALRRAPWPLWAVAAVWWVGVVALLLLAGAE